MAKTTKKSRVARTGRKKWLFVLIVVAVFIIVGIAICLMRSAAQRDLRAEERFTADKARFAQVEADMNEAYAAIVAAVGPPVREESGKSCSRTSVKFEEGTLGCQIYRRGYYEVIPDENRALKVLQDYYHLSDDQLYLARNLKGQDGTWTKEYDFSVMSTFACRFTLASEVVGKMKVNLWCYNTVERPIYPLAE